MGHSKLNCEVLDDDLAFEVRWAVAGESIVLQLVAKLGDREYMSFGLSGDESKSVMIGGDVAVAWVDSTLKGYAEDYYLADKSQCSGPTGSCPDTRFAEDTNNVRLLNAAMVNGYSIVTYQRPLKASDEYDLPIRTNQSQAIIWAIGPLNQRDEVSFHSSYLKRDSFIDFARPAKWNCPLPEGEKPGKQTIPIQNRHQEHVVSDEAVEPPAPSEPVEPEEPEEPVEEPSTTAASRREGGHRRRGGTRISTRQPAAEVAEEGQASRREATRTRGSNRVSQRGTQNQAVPPPTPVKERDAWYIPPIECYEPEDGVFYAQMGPTGGKRGYPAITGHVGWGISWYINGLLIPEINVVRGKTYNFITEGGDNPEISAKYHPFYITDDSVGGYAYKTPEEKKNVTIFSGARFDKNGEAQPTGTGRLCHWTHTGDKDADDFDSFGAYQRTLQLKCDVGEPGVIQWTPDRNTPDTVYYQCFTHRYLGWKINVHDTCEQGAASELKLAIVEAPESFSDLGASPSVRQEARVIPNRILIDDIKADNRSSQPTISEITLDQSTRTSQQKSDQNTSPPGHFIGQWNSFPRPSHQSLGHYVNYDKRTLGFRASPLDDLTKDFAAKNVLVVKRMTTTEQPTTKLTKPINFSFAAPNLIPKPLKSMHQPFYGPQVKNHFSSNPVGHKKLVYRQTPQKLMHPSLVYNIRPDIKFNPTFKTPHNNPQLFLNTLPMSISVPIKTQLTSDTATGVKNVEISPEQASTEREPEIQTASPLLSIYPSSMENYKFQTPVNNGFKPESIVIEGGFKPIINREIQDRVDDIEPEVDPEGEIGVIQIKGEKKFETPDVRDELEPIFVPSPQDKPSKLKYKKASKQPLKKEMVKVIIRTRSLIDSDIEPEMAAAERVESYYLPPPGQTDKPKIVSAKQPSEIDFEVPSLPSSSKIAASPPDIVVTFDGKRVSGASLTAKPFEKSVVLERGSKATEFLKAHPQSVPFQGDLPPLNPNVLFNSKLHNLSPPHSGVLNRDLDTPLLPPSGSTKLKRVRRAAHHNPEHTAQQMRDMNASNNATTSGAGLSVRFCFINLILCTTVLPLIFKH